MRKKNGLPVTRYAPGLDKFAKDNNLSDSHVEALLQMWNTTRGDRNFTQETWRRYYDLLIDLLSDTN